MKAIIKLTKEQFDLLSSSGTKVTNVDTDYYNLPLWFKAIGNDEFEVMGFEELPPHVKTFINARKPPITDDEIIEVSKKYDNIMSSMAESMWMPQGFIEGAKWMREKLTNS